MPKIGAENEQKKKIINAVLECICSTGIERITLEMIARKAGVSKGIVSYYFGNKDSLLLDAFKAFLAYYGRKIVNDIHPEMSATQMMEIILFHSLPPRSEEELTGEMPINVAEIDRVEDTNIPARKKALLYLNFFSRAMLENTLQQELQEAYRRDIAGVAKVIRYGQATGEFRSGNAEEMAWSIFAMIEGICVFRVVGFSRDDVFGAGEQDSSLIWPYLCCGKEQGTL